MLNYVVSSEMFYGAFPWSARIGCTTPPTVGRRSLVLSRRSTYDQKYARRVRAKERCRHPTRTSCSTWLPTSKRRDGGSGPDVGKKCSHVHRSRRRCPSQSSVYFIVHEVTGRVNKCSRMGILFYIPTINIQQRFSPPQRVEKL
jgi:hypothetical protein